MSNSLHHNSGITVLIKVKSPSFQLAASPTGRIITYRRKAVFGRWVTFHAVGGASVPRVSVLKVGGGGGGDMEAEVRWHAGVLRGRESLKCSFCHYQALKYFQKQEPKMLFDLHLAFFLDLWVDEEANIRPQTKKLRLASGKIGHPYTVLTSQVMKRCRLRWLKTISSTFQTVDFDGSLLPLFIS